ncbi:rod-binding protein [Gimesia maris]|uniref:rod-binding protein n=1 Tax=Gimesia maris TaxID=122 RepID=UPI00118A13F0|nr:rod-binding protein [Gimesia maris]QDT77417.1 flagellar rod assembly protein/muramidase FlgJ [Gimesia maris]|tara:strand:- start:80 stop:454 length:375 start_codon:yes stop_codon:yes gene_type:complete
MTSLSAIQPSLNQTSLLSNASGAPAELNQPGQNSSELKEKFQEFVAGTFYQQMFKAMRSAQGKPAYFHGGQAEEMFQSQLDQQISQDLAKKDGGSFSDALFSSFSRQLNANSLDSIDAAANITP